MAQATLSLLLVVGLGAAAMNQLTRPSVELGGPSGSDPGAVPACIAHGGHGCITSVDKIHGFSWRFLDRWFESKTLLKGGPDGTLRTVVTLSTPHVEEPARTFRGAMKLCPVEPEELQKVANDGALIVLQMARRSDARGFGSRPPSFGDPGSPLDPSSRSCAGNTVTRYTFSKGGRDFRAYVILLPKASEATRKSAIAVLNTLRVTDPPAERRCTTLAGP